MFPGDTVLDSSERPRDHEIPAAMSTSDVTSAHAGDADRGLSVVHATSTRGDECDVSAIS